MPNIFINSRTLYKFRVTQEIENLQIILQNNIIFKNIKSTHHCKLWKE